MVGVMDECPRPERRSFIFYVADSTADGRAPIYRIIRRRSRRFPELPANRVDRRDRMLLRSVHTTVQNGRHGIRVQRHGRGPLRGFRAHLLVHLLWLDHIRIVHGQRRY